MLLFNRYEYQPSTDLIGKGELSRVYKAMDKELLKPVAVKVYRGNDRSETIGVIDTGKFLALQHPHLCRYLHIEDIEREGAFGEPEKMQVCIQELVEGGDLASFYKQHPDLSLLAQVVSGLIEGLDYLHGQGVIHRRVKSSNLLVDEDGVGKVVDFGVGAGQAADPGGKDANFSAVVVAVPHMAPEQFNARKYGIDGKVAYNIDFWSLGITLYEVLTGETLFRNSPEDSRELVIRNILDPEPPEKLSRLPHPFHRLVARCVVKQADQRVQTAAELLEILAGGEADTVQLERTSPVRSSDDTQVLPTRSNDDTQVLPKAKVSDDTQVLPARSNNDTQVLPRAKVSDDTQVLPVRVSDDTQVLPVRSSDDTQVLPARSNDDTQVLPVRTSDDTQVLPVRSSDDTQILSARSEPPPPPPPPPQLAPPPPPPPMRSEEMHSLFNRYDYNPRTGLIGKGGFSRVYKAYDKKLNRWVALKIYKTGEFLDRYSPIAEIRRVINLDHPNICRYLDIEEIEKENGFGEKEITQICVMELLDGGNLLEYYTAHPTEQVLRKLVNDVLTGLAYLHKNGIIHRDIKPANILIRETYDGPVAKITDFGISKLSDSVNNHSSSALVVSIPYMAPEQLNVKKYGIQEKISFNLDLWALGVTIYEIVTGKILFKNDEKDSSEQIMTNIMAAGVPEKIAELPQPFYDIVYRCLVKDARERVQKADELIVLLNRTLPATAAAASAGSGASAGGGLAGAAASPGTGAPATTSAGPGNQVKAGADGQEKPAADGERKSAEKATAATGETSAAKPSRGFSIGAEEETQVKKGPSKHEQRIGLLRIAVVVVAVLLAGSLYVYYHNKKIKEAENLGIATQKADSVSIVEQPTQKAASVPVKQDSASQSTIQTPPVTDAAAATTAGAGVGRPTHPTAGTAGNHTASGTETKNAGGKTKLGTENPATGTTDNRATTAPTASGTTGAGTTAGGTAGSGTAAAGTAGSGTAATGTAGSGTAATGTAAAEDSNAMAGYYPTTSTTTHKPPGPSKTSNLPSKGSAGLASKYVLMLTTSQNCSISINNIPYGTLNKDRTMKLYLIPGAYVINATSTAHKSSQYTGRLEVKPEMLDQVGEFKIQL